MAMPSPGKFLVAQKRCTQCLYTPAKIVSDDRREQLIAETVQADSYFVCHKGTLTGNNQLCCRGFYETEDTMVIRLAKALGVVEFVPVPEVPNEAK